MITFQLRFMDFDVVTGQMVEVERDFPTAVARERFAAGVTVTDSRDKTDGDPVWW